MDLKELFSEYSDIAIAFSGGADSAYLLYSAKKYAKRVKAYYVKSAFQPEFEENDAKRLADELSVDLKIIYTDVLSDKNIADNSCNRCYYCKKKMMSIIKAEAQKDGFDIVADGTNASDNLEDRAGTKALNELSVLSPLKLCGVTKNEVRRLSEKAGLFTFNKSAYACLATRIKTGELITKEKLVKTEWAENLLYSMGFRDFRVRMEDNTAKIQIISSQLDLLLKKREEILKKLKNEYSFVLLDLEMRDEQ